MSTVDWNHDSIEINGINIHYVRHGSGEPLILLHGWPEFWYTYRKNIPALAEHFDVLVPDLRGFGETDTPELSTEKGYSIETLVEDLKQLLDGVAFDQVGLVSHDVGAYIAQAFARKYPRWLTGLFFFNCPYPGIGRRWASPEHLHEIWYQSFNQQPWAAELVGSNRQTCELYIRHFLSHWAYDSRVFEEDIDRWVDNFMQSDNLQGGFNWYLGADEARMELISNGASELPEIETPTKILWGAEDPVIRVEWADRLDEYFSEYQFSSVDEAGHFVHYEEPDIANEAIITFFSEHAE